MTYFLQVLACVVVALVIGFIWYGPIFGKAWMEVCGMENITPEMKAQMKKKMGGMLFLQAIMSGLSAHVFIAFLGATAFSGSMLAMWVWFGFLMPTVGGMALWSGKTPKLAWKMFFIMSGCQLVTYLAFGFVLGMWN